MSNNIDIERHKNILGILFVVFSGIHLFFIVIAILFLSELLPVIIEDPEALWILNLVRSVVITFSLIMTVPGFIAGIGLIYKKNWALLMAFIISIIALPLFPFWTFISVYTIVIFVLSHNKS